MGVSKQQLLNTVRQLKEYIDYTSGTSNLSKYLAKDNTTEYTPTADYHPATKKYVDSKSVNISAEEGNAIVAKEDGIYVPDVSDTNISAVSGNAIVKKQDGLYVPSVSEVKINPSDNNAIQQTENGIYVEDKTKDIDLIKTKINSISLYQKYLNVELDSCYCKLQSSYTPILNEYVPFAKLSGSMKVDNGLITVKPGQRVQISVEIGFQDDSSTTYGNIRFDIMDMTNNKFIKTIETLAYDKAYELIKGIGTCQYTNDADNECQIGVMVYQINVADILSPNYCYLNVQEIGRIQTIDPLEHVNTTQGVEDTPVGHVLAHIGSNAPKHYLICDGAEYNIADYPYLAQHFINEFGSVNNYGGDGETTFAVPDLRGDLLRGVSGNEEVGKHQDDSQEEVETWGTPVQYKSSNEETGTEIIGAPANTSVLYCIKYEPTYFFVNVPTEQVSQEITDLKQQNELLKTQNALMQEQINQLSEIIASINREG